MSSATSANSYILNKYCWMSRQLRNFNDWNSILQWSNAMLSVKNLLLQPQEAYIQSPPILPTKSAITVSNTHTALTISRPSSRSYQPEAEPCHTLSRTWINFQPQPPSPLSVYTSRELSIPTHTPPDVSLYPPSKRRKSILPPEVDYNTSTLPQHRSAENNTPTREPSVPTLPNASTISLHRITIKISPGTQIWYGCLHRHRGKTFWAHRQFAGSEAYIVLQDLSHPKNSFSVKKLTTGMKYNILLYDENLLRI